MNEMSNLVMSNAPIPQNIASSHVKLDDLQYDDAIKSYEEFVYSVSHDFSAPIRHVSEFTRLLAQSLPEVEKDQELYIHYIQSALKRMSEMQSALLTMSRLITAEQRFENIDMTDLVDNIIETLDLSTYSTKPVFTYDQLIPAQAVPNMARILFTQIIDNACRYGSKNGKQKISIESYERGQEIVFEIKDNGIGIDSEFTEVVFNIFRRLHGQDDYGGGIGAGLTIAKKIIAHHRGHIWIKSKIHEGTSVMFSLPRATI